MKELAEVLKRRAGLRMRQGVVTAVTGSTCSVRVGGSSVPVDGVQHLNSCAPQVGDVVWITSDGADLWIIGTHGDPPPIDPSRLPEFETYFADADPAGAPAAVTGLAGVAGPAGVQLSWDLPPEALWRTWEVYEGTAQGFTPGVPVVTTDTTVVTVPNTPGTGPLWYKVRAVNTRGESSTFVEVGPFTVPQIDTDAIADDAITAVKITDAAIETPKLAAGAVTAAKIDVADVQAAVVTADKVNALALNASSITTGTLSVDRIAAGSIMAAKLNVSDVQAAVVTAAAINALTIDAVKITGGSITGALLRTATSGARIEIDSSKANRVQMFSGDADEYLPGLLVSGSDQFVGGFIALRAPQVGEDDIPAEVALSPVGIALTTHQDSDFAQLTVGSAPGVVQVFGTLEVSDLVKARVPSCSIRRTTNGTISNNTDTYPSLSATATVEWDTDSFFDSDTPTQITIPVAGVYLLDLSFCWDSNATGWRSIGIAVNGTVITHQRIPSPGAVLCLQQVSCIRKLAANDTVKMYCRQTSGGDLTMTANDYAPRLSATWLRKTT